MLLKGGYKQKVRTLSENNKALVEALENYRYRCSENEKKIIQVSTTALQNSISAKAKLNKLAKDLKQLQLSVEDIISCMNTNSYAFPNMFTSNIKLKKPLDCLSKLVESVSEETLPNWKDFLVSENESFMEKETPKSPFSLIPTEKLKKSEKTKQKKIPSIQKQNRQKVLDLPSKSQLRKQDTSSNIQKPLSYKRRRSLREIQSHQEFSNKTMRKKQKPNPVPKSEKINKKNEHLAVNSNPELSVDDNLLSNVIRVINTDHPQANLEDVNENELHATNNVLDKHHKDIVLQKMTKKSLATLIPKAVKSSRPLNKDSDQNPSKTISCDESGRPKIILKPLKGKANKNTNKNEARIKVSSSGKKEKCFKEGIASGRIIQKSKENNKQLQNKKILCSVENIPYNEEMETTVTAEIHKPPTDKLTRKRMHSSNIAFKIMQPCVVLTDICETSLFIEEHDVADCSVDAIPEKVQNKKCSKKRTKGNLTHGKNYKSKGSIPSPPKSSRLCRNRGICYEENSLKKKLRRS